jgi:PAS domain S-box-containing protein
LLVGAGISCLLFRDTRTRERERAEAEFVRRATVRHTLTREVIGRYEDALFSLNALFTRESPITLTEFTRAAHRIEERTPGALAYEWVPAVPHEQRAAAEANFQRGYRMPALEFSEITAAGERIRAAERPTYFPIVFVEPLAGNEKVLGYDLMSGQTRGELELARDSRQLTLTRPIRLAQENEAGRLGVVLISPVWRPPESLESKEPDVFAGFVQAVFRTHELLERTRTRHPDTILDMLFVDDSEKDPALRILYYRPADDRALRTPSPTEAEFRRGLVNDLTIPLGGRVWRVLYRPRTGWIEEQFTALAWVRTAGVLGLTALLAGLVHALGRRNEVIENVVTERTAELAESRRELGSVLHALPGMAYRCRYDEQLTVLFVSDGARELTGRPAAEFIAGHVHFRDFVHADDLERVRSGTITALEERRDFELEFRIRLPDGTEKWVLSRGGGICDRAGELNFFEGLAIDITARKNAEHERIALERKLLEGQKLESLGLLAGGIAHDFNNLLTGILGNANLSRLTLPPGSPVDAQLRAIETASLRAAELCRQMLAYAGKGRFVIEAVDLGTLASGLVPLLDVSIARKAALRLVLAPALPPVLADATQLRQIVMNLVLNAADATVDRGGEIVLTTGTMRADSSLLGRCVTGATLAEGDYVFLEVSDRGCGMTPEVIAKIFDPFYTTKFAGRGLGLAAVLGIVRGHHGALQVVSEPGDGSRFRLLLPPAPASPAPVKNVTTPPAVEPWRRAGVALIIDDDEAVRTVTARFLATLGFTARVATDGRSGLAMFGENPGEFAFVVLDVLMPGMSGEETLTALRLIRAETPVLMISGYNEGDLLRRLGLPGIPLGFLQKPFNRDSLEEKLRELLG